MTSLPAATGDVPEVVRLALGRARTAGFLLGGLVFAASGAWLALSDTAIIEAGGRYDPAMLRLYGWGGVALGLLVSAFALRKLRDRRPGLVLDAAGLTDRTSLFASGFVPWRDIAGFRIHAEGHQRFVTVVLHDPASYAERGGWLRRQLNRMHHQRMGSPVFLVNAVLTVPFPHLLALCQRHRQRYGMPATDTALLTRADGPGPPRCDDD